MAEQPLEGTPMGARLKRVVMRSIDEAVRCGASSVEAEHLLLSIAANDDLAGRALAEVGLDHAAIEVALRGERERALRAAGIEPVGDDRLRSTRRSRPIWGASIREALRRADFRTARDGSRTEREPMAVVSALIGVLRAELGTVPRALAYAGVDRAALISHLEEL
jgi:Clp amino terminal domain, pathogenicity island component